MEIRKRDSRIKTMILIQGFKGRPAAVVREPMAEIIRKAQLANIGLVEKYAEDLKKLLCYSSLAKQKSFMRSFV